MKKIWLLIMISCSFFALLPSVVADQDISFIAKKDDKKHNSASRPTPPKEPNYNLVSIPLVNYVLITESDWSKLEAYFDAFDQYAEDADRELAKIKKLKKDKKRPTPPRLRLSSVATTDLPPLLKASKEKYLSLSAADRNTLESNLKEMRAYTQDVERLFNEHLKK
ncbi:hypothetical protein PVA45_07605 (plasmid) [Entomospira entomophila]|uniref:Uncharacterized protein n=1 Tax=Entomospira entomophila TaxID=2719988 RepID=A0A968GDZ0_9SPIO|nr:hypothetical protein [Entomospira entomophilus]NIZ41274.1 hypothetical protein [Entomospira entomophilus]WDI36198.1 hypothetical protein PVA45_07605 [Entomospira entomophilus]